MGYIADASYSFVSGSRFVAYAYGASYDDVDEYITLKILNENGTLERVTTEKKVKFNGTKWDSDTVYGQLAKTAENRMKPQLVMLQKNDEGKITAIFTSSDNGGGRELIKNQEMTGSNEWACKAASEQNIIGVSMLYDSNTKVFNVPSDAEVTDAKDSEFSVGGVKNDVKYQNSVSYKVTNDVSVNFNFIILHGGYIAAERLSCHDSTQTAAILRDINTYHIIIINILNCSRIIGKIYLQ